MLSDTNVPGQSFSWISVFETAFGRFKRRSSRNWNALGCTWTASPRTRSSRVSESSTHSPKRIRMSSLGKGGVRIIA